MTDVVQDFNVLKLKGKAGLIAGIALALLVVAALAAIFWPVGTRIGARIAGAAQRGKDKLVSAAQGAAGGSSDLEVAV